MGYFSISQIYREPAGYSRSSTEEAKEYSYLYKLMKEMFDPVFTALILGTAVLLLVRKGKNILRLKLMIAAVFILLYPLSIQPVRSSLSYVLGKNYLRVSLNGMEKLDAVVVLSGGSFEKGLTGESLPANESTSRLLHGLQTSRLSGARHLVLCGKGLNRTSDAEAMARTAGYI